MKHAKIVPTDSPSPDRKEALVLELEAAAAQAGGAAKQFIEGLLGLARADEPMPIWGGSPCMLRMIEEFGIKRTANRDGDLSKLARRFQDRFPKRKVNNYATLRTTLPGVEGQGVDVPLAALVAGLESEAQLLQEDERAAKLLRALAAQAAKDRILPRWNGVPSVRLFCRLNGIDWNANLRNGPLQAAWTRWSGFFGLSTKVLTVSGDGIVEQDHAPTMIGRWIEELKAADPPQFMPSAPVTRTKGVRKPSFIYIHRRFGIDYRTLRTPAIRALIDEDARRGLGPEWKPDLEGEAVLTTRRNEIVAWVESLQAGGGTVPARPRRLHCVDIDAIMKLMGKDWPSLQGDRSLLRRLSLLGLNFENAIAAPDGGAMTFADAIREFPEWRAAWPDVKESSKAPTRSNAKGALIKLMDFLGKDQGSAVGEDLGTDLKVPLAKMQAEEALG